MSSSAPFSIRLLTPADVVLMDAMLTTFGEVETYSGARRSRAYLARLLGSDCFIALAALKGSVVVGGIGAFERPARTLHLLLIDCGGPDGRGSGPTAPWNRGIRAGANGLDHAGMVTPNE
jgi:hypothetical protein